MIIGLLVLMLVTISCSGNSASDAPRTPRPVPTVNELLTGGSIVRSVDTKVSESAVTPEPVELRPTRTPFPTPEPTAELPPPIAIYKDEIEAGWTTKYSSMDHQLDYSAETFEGTNAIRLSPQIGKRSVFFTLEKNARPVREDRVLGISFQLYSGEEGLSIEELAMAIVGSDGNTYWVKNDVSTVNVRNPNPGWLPEDDPISNLYAQNFAETQLGFLGIPRDIPPNTWVEGINYLDERIYDPLYKNIVGFYFKTETTVRHDLLLDNVELIVLGSDVVP